MPGFTAVKAPKEVTTSFIGNVTTGFVYFDPISKTDTLKQNHYPGEQGPGKVDNIQPEMQLFANGKKGEADISLLLDVYGNEWSGFRRNNTNLSLTYSDHSVVLGDFYENNSETSISGRKLTGIKYDGNFFEMGRGTKRVNAKLAFGQSETPKLYGTHELDLYNTPIDTGMSVRQQLTYCAGVVIKPTLFSSVGIRGLIARDQGYKTFIGATSVSDPRAPNLVQAQTGCIDGKVDLLGGKLSLNAELDMGSSDTLRDTLLNDKGKIDKVAWYDPQAQDAVASVFGSIPSGKNYALTIGVSGETRGYKLGLTGSQIAPSFFAAGNPYLETDRRGLLFTVDKDFSEALSASLSGEYQRRTISVVPVDNSTIHVNGKYVFGQNLPEISGEYMFYYETNKETQNMRILDSVTIKDSVTFDTASHYADMSYSLRDFKNLIGLEAKQQFANDMDYSIKYQLLREDDATAYLDPLDKNKKNGIQHQVTARYGFKIGKGLRNRTTVRVVSKNQVQDSLQGLSYKISDEIKLVLIPRKLTINVKGEYSNKTDKKILTSSTDTTATSLKQAIMTNFTGFEAEVKYTLNAKWSFTLRGRYENAYDETSGSRENYTAKIMSFYMTLLF
jgi:hypothetical protein